ncbi:hypothetical protein CYMTET_5315 [Cymbomonas tetramitiformis]|uniref:Deoxynucleoside kinase domain-containing protein n=1 Tax=Cymbomonas tetramitiformis TaxID=36881 RepID=A0AAE0LJ74_9CHLO|nr:hypothetical protein CYMTET_5315 [Cymbomonas tetramitiformis]
MKANDCASPTSICPEISNRVSFAVEGNIGVGKSTFLELIKSDETLTRLVDLHEEPVAQWQAVGGNPKHNMLNAFYSDSTRHAYTFQNYVFITRFLQHHNAAMNPKAPCCLLERSVFTDCCVFAKTVLEEGLMTDLEGAVYHSWFNPVLQTLPHLVPDAFVYLRASPQSCYRRLCIRSRTEEAAVGLDYLGKIHDKHEAWFVHGSMPATITPTGQAVSCGKLGEDLDGTSAVNVRVLDGKHSHAMLDGKTAIVVDCDAHLDNSGRALLVHELKVIFQQMGVFKC